MSSCTVTTDSFIRETGDLEVSIKYHKLMQDSLAEDSLYSRVKETLFHQFADLQLTEKEKAGYIVDFMGKFAVELSKSSLGAAISWAKEERDGPYHLAKVKADVEHGLIAQELIKEQVCEARAKTDLICAQITTTVANSIRDNGAVESYEPDSECKPAYLKDEGLKYQQSKQVEASTYQIFADAYRKSGVVHIGVDTDSMRKGMSAPTHAAGGEAAGYTCQQTANAERQRIAYEDSKRNHAANSSASMIGQLLSAEEPPTNGQWAIWKEAVDYLNTTYTTT